MSAVLRSCAVRVMEVITPLKPLFVGGFKPPRAALAEDRRGERSRYGVRLRRQFGVQGDERKWIVNDVCWLTLRMRASAS